MGVVRSETELFPPRVYCVTWNVNGRVPPTSVDLMLKEYNVKGETDSPIPDIFAIG